MNKTSRISAYVKYVLPLILIGLVLSCSESSVSGVEDAVGIDENTQFKRNSQENEFTGDAGEGDFVGINESDNPDYGIFEYDLWAGKTISAGTVTITNNDSEFQITVDSNGGSDIGEMHVYVWNDLSEIPTKRPAPGQAPYSAENINADSFTLGIPYTFNCGDTFYISVHAAMVEDGGDNKDDDPDSAGETAYAGGGNTTDGYPHVRGSWWGYITYTVTCYFDISGSVYEDMEMDGNLDGGETMFGGITINLLDADGNAVATTQTNADGSYLFEHVEGGNDYTVVVGNDPDGDYLAYENAGGWSVTDLSSDQTGIDFGYIPLFDLSGTVYNDADNSFSWNDEDGFEGITVVLTAENGDQFVTTTDADGNYFFENMLPGTYTVTVLDGPDGYDATENANGFTLDLNADSTGINFGFYMETVTYDPCDTNQDGTVSTEEQEACDSTGEDDDFPTWGQDISHVILVFDSAPAGDNDGYYTVKIDEWPDGADPDLDNSIDDILTYLIANDPNVDSGSILLGSSIKGGQQTTAYFAYNDESGNGADTPPAGLGFGYPGGSENESPQSAVDEVYNYVEVF